MTYSISEWVKKLKNVASKTGYTASLVKRDGSYIITIAPREGDSVIMRKNGKNGMYTDHAPAERGQGLLEFALLLAAVLLVGLVLVSLFAPVFDRLFSGLGSL